MNKRRAQTTWRLYVGAAAIIIGKLGWLVLVAQGILAILPPHKISFLGTSLVGVVSLSLILVGSVAVRDRSVLWQVLLQSTAGGAIVAGVRLLVGGVFYNPSGLIGDIGVVGVAALWLGFFAARLMRQLQSKLKITHDAV